MAKLSSIRRLAPELRELIATMRDGGSTIDEILAELHNRGATVSRSALGRHTQQLDELGAGSGGAVQAELCELRRAIADEHEASRAAIGMVRGEVATLSGEIRALVGVLRER